jgi:translation initiation factor 2A
LNDSTGKSYYGEHSLQYVRIHKGKNRHFIPVFDNQIQDVSWTPDGKEFIVDSEKKPATATMYDSDGQPKFEFGKKFRNTLRICPFGNSLMVGGFGNITKGEMDFWNIENLKETGVTVAKAPCATQINWSACGRYVLTSVLYERLKVDNGFNIHRANGTRALMSCGATTQHGEAWGMIFPPSSELLSR